MTTRKPDRKKAPPRDDAPALPVNRRIGNRPLSPAKDRPRTRQRGATEARRAPPWPRSADTDLFALCHGADADGAPLPFLLVLAFDTAPAMRAHLTECRKRGLHVAASS